MIQNLGEKRNVVRFLYAVLDLFAPQLGNVQWLLSVGCQLSRIFCVSLRLRRDLQCYKSGGTRQKKISREFYECQDRKTPSANKLNQAEVSMPVHYANIL